MSEESRARAMAAVIELMQERRSRRVEGVDATRLAHAAPVLSELALAMEEVQPGLRLGGISIVPTTGEVLLTVASGCQQPDGCTDYGLARTLAHRLHLDSVAQHHLGDGSVLTRWSGEWQDWPVTVQVHSSPVGGRS